MWLVVSHLPRSSLAVWDREYAKSYQTLGDILVVIVALHLILDEFKLSKGRHLSGFLSKVPGTQQKHALQTKTVQYLQE